MPLLTKPLPEHYCVLRGVPSSWGPKDVLLFASNLLGRRLLDVHKGRRLIQMDCEQIHEGSWTMVFGYEEPLKPADTIRR